MYRAPPQLRIKFLPPGFFLVDARLVVFLNEHTVYDGSFKQGFDVAFPFAPGRHVIITWIEMSATSRNREYTVDVPADGCTILLAYSRFWGNFDKTPTLVPP